MKVKSTKISDEKTELLITVPADRVREAIRFIDYQLAFQSGVNPQGVEDLSAAVKEVVGEAYYNSFLDFEVMRYLAPFAVTQEKISIMGTPKVDSTGTKVEPGKDLTFRATVVTKPIYEIDDFSPVKIQVPRLSVSEYDIDEQLINIAESHVTYERDEDRPLQDGDDLYFSIRTVDKEGLLIPALNADRRAYKIGQNYLPGGFDEHLIGMEVGQTKTFDITAPEFNRENPGDSNAAETYTFTITILELQKRIIPAITDLWVKENLPGLTSVPELREEIRRQIMQHMQKDLEQMKSYAAATEFAKRFKGKIPDEYYELTREDILNNLHQNLQAQGKTLQEFINEQAGGEQQFSMQLMMQTREMLVQSFSLDALARHLKIKVTEEDIEETFHLMAPNHEMEARMEFEMTGRMYSIEEGAMRNKANKWLVETAEIEYVERPFM